MSTHRASVKAKKARRSIVHGLAIKDVARGQDHGIAHQCEHDGISESLRRILHLLADRCRQLGQQLSSPGQASAGVGEGASGSGCTANIPADQLQRDRGAPADWNGPREQAGECLVHLLLPARLVVADELEISEVMVEMSMPRRV
eukprot:scaffold9408_cov35-Tisochrysis_lutea.AAC.3